MALYSSKTPRDLNYDPQPFRDERGNRWILPVTFQPRTFTHDPRPEFDHAQHNEPNPIILDFRDMVGIAQLWLEAIEGPEGDAFLAGTPKEFGRIDADHITHARKVLTRLANLGKV